ncbi:DnaD domain protein [Clostridium sporogenes]|uniref:DnaD domain protein n=1 Tax=Clostridium sporogenes TaxID=1509 RepID=A0A1L3NM57_CLOSG|nr:DnaD domain protein [Clostridium sporogenes]APH17227.1 DnaD domain protein [Clostridium sporogenes]
MAIDETGETEDNFIDIGKNRFANIGKSYEIKDSYTDITKDYEGAHKGLASKEIISNKQEIINNKEEVISNSCCSNKEKESKNNIQDNNDFKVDMYTKAATKINTTTDTTVKPDMVKSCRVNFKNIKDILAVFEINIHKAVPMEEKKIIGWGNKFSYDVIVMAIEEAIVNNIKNIGYIEKILNTWFSKGLNSIEDIKSYKARWEEKKKKIKSKENTVDRWNDFEQREYDFGANCCYAVNVSLVKVA